MSNIRQTVIETLSQSGPLPVAALATAAQLSPIAIRYHLGLLVRDGLIVQQRAAARGKVGRPPALYALADRGQERLPKKYHTLAVELLDEISDSLGAKEARSMLRRAGRHAASAAPALRVGAGVEARLNRATRFLTERGYMARWEKSKDYFLLNVCNCPYHEVAREHREVCDMDVALVGALLDAPAKMTRCMASRGGQCQFVVPRKLSSNKKG
jgi:predicted ArsR family transcriptional regulator